MSINGKTFDHRPVNELFAIVRGDLRRYDEQGLIDDGNLIKTVMYCNDKLGIPIREIKQVCIPIEDFKGELPLNFEKLYFVCALKATNTGVHTLRNPFDNSFDSDIIKEVDIDRGIMGNQQTVSIVIKRESKTFMHQQSMWIPLSLHASSSNLCHVSCPNLRKNGRYEIEIKDDIIHTPFRSGELYMMYLGIMEDEDGNVLFPFHPMITPYYEWVIKEKILMDALFNDDESFEKTQALLKIAQAERLKAFTDAWNITLEKGYGEYVEMQRKKELKYYNQYFKFLQ